VRPAPPGGGVENLTDGSPIDLDDDLDMIARLRLGPDVFDKLAGWPPGAFAAETWGLAIRLHGPCSETDHDALDAHPEARRVARWSTSKPKATGLRVS
jgi:hypothetical protein